MGVNENIMVTLRPDGRPGVRMTRDDYNLLAEFILSQMQKYKEITIQELIEITEQEFASKFLSNTGWYALSVKLDLQAQGKIKSVQKRDPFRVNRTPSLQLRKTPKNAYT